MKKQVDKKQQFRRLASQRTNNVLQKLKILGNCANRGAYDYTEEDIQKIFHEIDSAVKETKSKFYFPRKDKFTL